MDSKDYWLERETQNALKSDRYADKQIELITRWFNRSKKEMSSKVLEFYRKYAEKEGVTLNQAKQQLNDPRLLKTTLEEYYSLSEKSLYSAEIQQYLDKINASQSISREDFLKLQLDLILQNVYNNYEEITTNTLTSSFEDSYYKDMFDFQQYQGFGNSFNRLSTNQILAAVTTNWSGKNYSERIWDQKISLARRVNRIITTGMITGRSNKEMRQELEKEVDTSTYNARRLIRTESCYVTGQAAMLSYKQNDTKKYKYYAVLDFKTSQICQDLDGKAFDVDKAEVGINYPPMHPHCRSRTAPCIPNDELDKISGVGTRAARDHEGNTYEVPADMNYKDWHKKYVEGIPEAELYEKKIRNIYGDNIQYKKYKNILEKDAPKSLDDMQTLKYTDEENYKKLKWDYGFTNRYRAKDVSELVPHYAEPQGINKKLTAYCLNKEHDVGKHKAIVFESALGYIPENADKLERQLRNGLKKFKFNNVEETEHGTKYSVKMLVNGVNGNKQPLSTAWQIDKGTDELRMVTAFVDKNTRP